MPVPYRKTSKTAPTPCAAYIDVIWLRSDRTFYGGVLIIDGKGQPLEFVYNSLTAPSGFLWPDDQVQSLGVASLCHSLFAACWSEPELLVCRATLAPPAYCKSEIAPSIPFAQAIDPGNGFEATWNWVNDPPPTSMSSHSLAEALRARGFAVEPFNRIRVGLREVYPNATWSEAFDDSHSGTS